jgi:CBS domain-containing protein
MRHHHAPVEIARMLMQPMPYTAAADDHLLDAAERMTGHGVRHLPVVDGDQHVLGMLSDGDVRAVIGDSARALNHHDAVVRVRSLRVDDAMTRDPFVVHDDTPFEEVVDVFTKQRVGAVPVIDARDRLVGIISYVDVLKKANAL